MLPLQRLGALGLKLPDEEGRGWRDGRRGVVGAEDIPAKRLTE
jgi:hypothetical protein